MKSIVINTEYIRLDSLLKLAGAVQTGGQAKIWIQEGKIFVNGTPCTQRGKKIINGDIVSLKDTHEEFQIQSEIH